ncbi:MAG: bifunctional demethylmenaquinone methyltransferase/2-methoxy-6-polyprenyl-1,4-benzoquinol methylase UbiE [Phycisphaerales bacterium]|nr:bifunctional demethylmenaquinone methyltransferase/2-methoxy-6-polyprenyl-1,4-benzoquinol methylase UbiE [Phycisphaerales bacterium]
MTPADASNPPPAWTEPELAGNPHADAGKPEKVRRMFAAIAHRYDLNNRLHSFWRDQAWRRAAVRMAGVRPADRVLDVACGTGDLTRAFADAGPAEVIGADFTPQMLDIARAKRGRVIEYLEADAQNLPFPDGRFDVVSIAFGIRNVQRPERALAEFFRVLAPGGRLIVLEFAEPRLAPVRWINGLYTKRVMPLTATLISGDRSGAYRYLPRSVETFLTREEMERALRAAGFASVRQRAMTFGVCVAYRADKPGA